MGWLFTAEVAVALVVAVLVLPPVWLYLRRRWLSSQGGVFDCALRREDGHHTRWSTGMARYADDELQWFRTFSLRLTPRIVLTRDHTAQLGTRTPSPSEEVVMFSGDGIMRVRDDQAGTARVLELAMSREALTGLMSWLEAAPPGGDAYSGLEQRA